MKNLLKLSLGISIFLVSCNALNDPYYGGGYNDPYYNGGYRDGYYERREAERARNERYRLERERDRVEAERRRLEEERRREGVYRPQSPPPARQPDRCPPGFSPSERKCTPAERKRGCRDIRTPSGLGCVSR